MENSRSRSLVNLKLINGFKITQMDSNSRCDAKLMGKDSYKKFNKPPKSILFEPSSYKR